MYQKESLGLNEAKGAVEAMLQEALKEPQRPVAMAVVDDQGQLMYYARMDGATLFNQVMAVRKASTAAQIGIDTLTFREGLKALDMSFGDFGIIDLTVVQGGLSVVKPGGRPVLGGIGVSGRMAHEDEAIARIGLNALKL